LRAIKKLLKALAIFILLFVLAFAGFILWNNFPPLPRISILGIQKNFTSVAPSPPALLKVVSYNIQYGSGFKGEKEKALDIKSFYKRLEAIVEILQEIDADIVLLQEVDFKAKRTQSIDQADFIAKRAGYAYLARAPHWKKKFFPNLNGLIGPLNHGLAILSRFPLSKNESRVFAHPSEAPFYVRWLYSPHGGQKAEVQVGKTAITLMNVHLEPWAQKTREKSVRNLVKWIEEQKGPLILGGDFNAIPPEAPIKTYTNLEDTPWFIDKKQWDLENDITISAIRNLPGFTDAIPPDVYLKDEKSAFTYPADNPVQRLDYIFAGKGAKMAGGFVFKEAAEESDHLPIVGLVDYGLVYEPYAPMMPPTTPNPKKVHPASSK